MVQNYKTLNPIEKGTRVFLWISRQGVDKMKETWKDIPGYRGKYQLDREGNCRRVYPSGKYRMMTPFRKQRKNSSDKRFVKLTIDGKAKECNFLQLMAITFLGPAPEGYVPYHINGCQGDNYINNIAYISRKELGKLTGPTSRRKAVAKINADGEIVEIYKSAREAGRKNFMSYQTINDRCNRKCKTAFAPDGYAYAWEDSEVSMKHAIRKIEQADGYLHMPKAPAVQFDF